MPTEALNAEQIKQAINHQGITNVQVFNSLDSTNVWALQHAACGEACLAEQQTAGRGRRGRVWHSPQQGNLYLSLKWCFDEKPKHFGLLSLLVGIIVAECLEKEGLQGHGVKWPNDILWQGKKLGGILLESKGNLKEVVIGIGLNINMQITQNIDQPWCNLKQILSKEINRNILASNLLAALAEALQNFHAISINEFTTKWQHWDILRNQDVTAFYKNKEIQGKAIGIDSDGTLELRLKNGSIQKFTASDVSIKANE